MCIILLVVQHHLIDFIKSGIFQCIFSDDLYYKSIDPIHQAFIKISEIMRHYICENDSISNTYPMGKLIIIQTLYGMTKCMSVIQFFPLSFFFFISHHNIRFDTDI